MKKLFVVCLMGAGVATAAVFLLKLPINSVLFYGFLLVCPLMHLFMMHGDKNKNSKHNHH